MILTTLQLPPIDPYMIILERGGRKARWKTYIYIHQLEMNAAGLKNLLYAQHDDSSSSSTDCSGFALQLSIDCSRMVNQSESSCQIRLFDIQGRSMVEIQSLHENDGFIESTTTDMRPLIDHNRYKYFDKFVKQSFKDAVVRVANSRQTVVSW